MIAMKFTIELSYTTLIVVGGPSDSTANETRDFSRGTTK